jgi:hypothetical protein
MTYNGGRIVHIIVKNRLNYDAHIRRPPAGCQLLEII